LAQVEIVPAVGAGGREPDAKDANASYSFDDPSKQRAGVEPLPNSPLAQPAGQADPPKVNPAPTIVMRKRLINPETMAMNRAEGSAAEVRDRV